MGGSFYWCCGYVGFFFFCFPLGVCVSVSDCMNALVDGMRYSGSAPGDVLVDYVRVYQRKTRTPSSCGDVPPAQRVSPFLDILQPLSDFTPT